MTKLTQKQLIEQIEMLKGIKPRKEWATLLKSQILPEQQLQATITAQKVSFLGILSSVFAPKKLVYSLAVILFLVIGVFGFASQTMPGDLLFPVRKITEQSQAALTGHTGLKQSVATLNNRINDLAQVAKAGRTDSIPSAISEISADASALVKDLQNNTGPGGYPNKQTIKDIVVSLKTLADVPGTDLTANQDVKNLYQTVVQSQIADLQEATLTDEQKATLSEVEELYNQAKYVEALEKILLINN